MREKIDKFIKGFSNITREESDYLKHVLNWNNETKRAFMIAKNIYDNKLNGYGEISPIYEIKLSSRLYNCLYENRITHLEMLCMYTKEKIMEWRNMGKKTFEELHLILKKKNIQLLDEKQENHIGPQLYVDHSEEQENVIPSLDIPREG